MYFIIGFYIGIIVMIITLISPFNKKLRKIITSIMNDSLAFSVIHHHIEDKEIKDSKGIWRILSSYLVVILFSLIFFFCTWLIYPIILLITILYFSLKKFYLNK